MTDSLAPNARTFASGVVYRQPQDPKLLGYPGHGYQKTEVAGMVFERDIAIPLSDGVTIYADLYRPVGVDEPLPVLIAWSPYGKHSPTTVEVMTQLMPGHDIDSANVTDQYHFEGAERTYWCKHHYALLFPDPRGTWNSEGQHSLFSDAEAHDCYDVIEWAVTQPWSNGKVGLIGQSYYAMSQWKVAALRPPHLAAIAPWGASTNFVEQTAHHGGVPETAFTAQFFMFTGNADHGPVEDVGITAQAHPFADEYWADKATRLQDIVVPTYAVADWTDVHIHTPGTMDGWRAISSEQKWLEINGRKKWARFVEPEPVERLRAFYDKFLKGVDTQVDSWPPVWVEVREDYMVGQMYDEQEWPLARTDYRRLYLHADHTASFEPEGSEKSLEYDAAEGSAQFDLVLSEDLEVTGYAKLRLWVQADGSDDMDLFVALRHIDATGRHVTYPLDTIHNNGEAAFGWLRVSKRTLDPDRSTDFQPVLTHDRELRLSPGEIVPVDIAIQPSGTLFRAGDTLRVLIQGSDVVKNEVSAARHNNLRNQGRHIVHLGGNYDSYLLLPVIPPRT